MENRDELIRRQLDEISKLISKNLEKLAEEQFGSKKPAKKECEIVPFPSSKNS